MRLFIILLFIFPPISKAQPGYRVFDFIDPSLKSFSVGTQVGFCSYYGDLCATDECYNQINFSTGIVSTIRANDYFFFNLNGNYYRIEGSDAKSSNEHRIPRNLSFRADNFECSFVGNFEFMNFNSFRFITRKEFPLSLYTSLGIGFTTNNPKAFYKGKWYNLRQLETERITYSPVALTIPFGIGIAYRQTENLNFSLNLGYRYSFTDYLDDVSTTYKNPSEFTNPLALELQYRGDEVPYGRKGVIRGNPNSKDGYVIVGFRVEYKIPKVKLDFIGRRNFSKGNDSNKPIRKPATRRSF